MFIQEEASDDKVEAYVMLSHNTDSMENEDGKNKTVVVKRSRLTFNEKECVVLNFTEITTQKRLKREVEKCNLLTTLCTSVHHEMLSPLKTNVEFA